MPSMAIPIANIVNAGRTGTTVNIVQAAIAYPGSQKNPSPLAEGETQLPAPITVIR